MKGIYSPDDDLGNTSEEDVTFELDSQGNPIDKSKSEITFVDDEQEQERIRSRPDIPNNSEIT